MKKEAWFGISFMILTVLGVLFMMPPFAQWTNGHLGLLMLAMIVIAIMMGFPTAFTLMGMGTMFAFFAYYSANPNLALTQTFDLVSQRAYAVMNNDVLISIPLFVFMGYLVERANLIGRLFKSLHLATTRIPGSLAVATVITCAIFATATGIIGACVTLMGLLAFPAMLKAGYSVRLSAGVVTAGGTLGILIPPSVLLILYGATAGVSVVQLYAGAFLPGIMLTGLYIGYIIVSAKLNPSTAPPLSAEEQIVELPKFAEIISKKSNNALVGLIGAIKGKRNADVPMKTLLTHMIIAILPAIAAVLIVLIVYLWTTAPTLVDTSGLQEMGMAAEETVQESTESGALQEMGAAGVQEPPAEPAPAAQMAAPAEAPKPPVASAPAAPAPGRDAPPTVFWVTLAVMGIGTLIFYVIFTFARLEIFKMLLGSFFPLALIILGVLG
jgi:TRAP-type mannitol/chloroaromatic compound transport system permease large subunit